MNNNDNNKKDMEVTTVGTSVLTRHNAYSFEIVSLGLNLGLPRVIRKTG